jgi:hypothetical protein
MAYIHENKSFIEQTRIVYLEFSVTVHLLQRSNLFLSISVSQSNCHWNINTVWNQAYDKKSQNLII